MKKFGLIFSTFFFMSVLMSCSNPDNFDGSIAVWTFSDVNNSSINNNQLKSYGDLSFTKLKGEDAKASKERGGDGAIVQFNGGWFDAGQGIKEELNLSGKNMSILVRMRADEVKGLVPILTKAGDDQSIAYCIYLNAVGNDIYIQAKVGNDYIAGANLLQYKLPKDKILNWHDVIFRFNGNTSELYVDGQLRDDEVTVGEIRDWNRKPLLIGAQYKAPYGYADISEDQVETKFIGAIDHIALWNSYLSDENIKKFSGVTELLDGRPQYYDEKYRPQFHFTAKKNWLNDPNGLVYYDGVYHLFFQYMPPHRPGAYKDWGHAVSTDLVHWEQTPNHITPHKVWAGCWSGSAVVDHENVAGFQTGSEKTIIAFITNGGNPSSGLGPLCTQCIAYSTDGGNTFTYYDQNPVIKNIRGANRDPKVVWDENSKKWIMSLYMDIDNDFGLFSSSDLKEWEYLSTASLKGVAECPGFEALPVDGDSTNKKWLFFGANGNYMIGSFDGKNFIPETDVLIADYGKNFYAAQTWSDVPDGRCIHIAWMPTQRYPNMPFEQQMNFPTELTLKNTSEGVRVFRMPVKEIQNLYEKNTKLNKVDLRPGENLFKDLDNEHYDIDLEVGLKKSTTFDIGIRGANIHYDAGKNIISCGGSAVENNIVPENWKSGENANVENFNNLGEAPLKPVDGKIRLRILIDRTSIEVFGNDGQVVITSSFMPEDKKSYSLTANEEINVSAEVNSLKSAWK
jgi:sucrose-6-phosphate hydrolase SacC (GH32 family)